LGSFYYAKSGKGEKGLMLVVGGWWLVVKNISLTLLFSIFASAFNSFLKENTIYFI
jgi:hypothetical protein